MEKIKLAIITASGAVGSMVANLFGGWDKDLQTLLIFMGVDFLMGLIVAGVFKRSSKSKTGSLESRAGFKGLCRKGVALLIVLIAHRLDVTLGLSYIRTAVIIGFIVNESLSIVENAGLMGLPLPSVIAKALEQLKKTTTEDDQDAA